jgi:hypothetical protein
MKSGCRAPELAALGVSAINRTRRAMRSGSLLEKRVVLDGVEQFLQRPNVDPILGPELLGPRVEEDPALETPERSDGAKPPERIAGGS